MAKQLVFGYKKYLLVKNEKHASTVNAILNTQTFIYTSIIKKIYTN